MAVQAGPTEKRYAANGVSPTYTIPFLLIDAGDLQVVLNGTPVTSGFTLAGVGGATSSITFTVPPLGNLYLYLDVPFQRLVDYQLNGDFLSTTVNRDLDRIWQALKQLYRFSGRSPMLGVNDIDGEGFYLAKGNSITGLASANGVMDAATNWEDLLVYVASILATGQGPINSAQNLVYVYPDLVGRAIQTLATKNDPLLGAAGIAFRNRTVYAKLMETLTVDDFGAVGDGVTNDNAAFLAMAAATGGTIRLSNKEYFVGLLLLTTYIQVKIIGISQPSPNVTLTKLVNGSVIIGRVYVEVNEAYYDSFGVDCGPARGIADGDGLVSNAKPGVTGYNCVVNRVSSMGAAETGTSHGVLIQGYDRHTITNIYNANRQFGVVSKNRNGIISNVLGDNIRTALVYPKGDVPSSAGGVASGICAGIEINNVRLNASLGNITAVAVYCHASTEACSDIKAVNVHQTNGFTPFRIQGSGVITDPAISGIQASNISSDRAQVGFWVDGYAYDFQLNNIRANNPATGSSLVMGTNSQGWSVDGLHTLISDAGITAISCASFNGIGSWNNVSVRGGALPRTIDVQAGSIGTIGCGNFHGNCNISTSGPLTGINGAVASAARIDVQPGKVLQLSGNVNMAAATNKAFCNILSTAKQEVFSCGAIISGSYASVTVRLNDFQLTVEPSLPAGLTSISLTGVTVKM